MSERSRFSDAGVQVARRIYRHGHKAYRTVRNSLLFGMYQLLNRFSHRSVTGSANAVVSLTSYGKRAQVCAYTIESIARGAVRPQRVILWLDDESLIAAPPRALARLAERGLEIRLSANYGPHTKYYPAVAESVSADLPLVTADDDTFYPRSWLSKLLAVHNRFPNDVVCYRAWVIQVRGGVIEPYNRWLHCRTTAASRRNFATGVSGVSYPPAFQALLATEGARFMDITPRADDIWLHWMALRSGFRVRQVGPKPIHFPTMPGTIDSGLLWENVHDSGNDRVISQLYNESDIALLGGAEL